MRITHSLRIHKGTIVAPLVFAPFIVATSKLTYFNKGCMDGFGHFIFGAAVIVLIGGPLTVLVSILFLAEFRKFFPTLNSKAKAFYLFGHALTLLAMPLAIWVALEIFHQKDPFDFRSKLHIAYGGLGAKREAVKPEPQVKEAQQTMAHQAA